MTAEAAVQAGVATEQDRTNQIRLLLGEANWTRYEQYERTWPARSLADQFNKQLGPFPLNDNQMAALRQAIQGEPLEVTRGLAGDLTVAALVFPEELNRSLERQREANGQILQQAAGFLDPGQVETLGLMQASNLSTQKRNVLYSLRRL